jgi:hypothetical protein
VVTAGAWHVLTVVSEPSKGAVRTFVDGQLSSEIAGLPGAELALQHQLTVFGGAQQRDLRGGQLRGLLLHSRPLSEGEVAAVSERLLRRLRPVLLWAPAYLPSADDERAVQSLRSKGFEVQRLGSPDDVVPWLARSGRTDAAVLSHLWAVAREDEEGAGVIAGADADASKPRGLRLAEQLAAMGSPVPVFLNVAVPPEPTREYILDELVEAKFKNGSFFPGTITRVISAPSQPHAQAQAGDQRCDNGHGEDGDEARVGHCYDVRFDDGVFEAAIPAARIRPRSAKDSKVVRRRAFSPADHAKELKRLGAKAYSATAHMEGMVCLAAAKRPRTHAYGFSAEAKPEQR